jgi:antitoxin HicB
MPESFKPTGRIDAGKTKIQGIAIMARKNPHIGSSFESWLEDAGIREEVTATAIKAVIARQLASEMKKKKITKQRMAELMKTSRAQVDRLLDPDNGSATIESLQRAAKIVGRELRLQLV